MPIIRTVNLTKKFRDLVAVDNVSLDIEEKECFGLLGPNGAGKTSLIRMLTAVSPPTAGTIEVMGLDLSKHPREVKARLGVVPQVDNLDEDLNVIQNLMTFARYFAIPPAEARRRSLDILREMRLEEKKTARINELSGGMKRRLLIGRGLINNPGIIILDEPSIGLDPQARHMVWQLLRGLKGQGVTLLLCTQNMEEAAILCDRTAVMHRGRVIALDTPRELIRQHVGERIWEVWADTVDKEQLVRELEARRLEYEVGDGQIHVFHIDDKASAGLPGTARPATLEDVFFKLTGRSLVE
jgi:lipooligosaccharide transport system ATP-binding protein